MSTLRTRILSPKVKALILAGLISGLLITGIANMSYVPQGKSFFEFDQTGSPCAFSICSLL